MFFILISESGLEHSIKNGMKYKQGVIKFTVKQLLQLLLPLLIYFTAEFNPVLCSVKVCGLPHILQTPENMSLAVGDTARFLCTVDMTCMVSYVEWYKHNDNGETNGHAGLSVDSNFVMLYIV